ncbi:uncharacterized protein LOC129743517 [Uranotaenia lowii]|uniref:uncharacterized protein LOC129743517 n=1 Tax=Uranotaenia lowii TaxID=190385 RepID=UPI002478FDAB|nr:uncharacterized protein LOC129743517 [Uranotaenia lowii]
MVLTIRGTVPPNHVWFGYLRVATRPYYPRPMQCFLCGKFGHTKVRCPNQPICPTCGESEIHQTCPNPAHCVNCQGDHPTVNRECPNFQHEQNIIRLRVDLGISHPDAVKQYRSRLNAATNSKLQLRLDNAKSTTPAEETRIKLLEKQIAILLEKNAQLQARILEIEKRNNTSEDSDTTLTDTNSEASMDIEDHSPSVNSTPKRGRGSESPDQTSPVRNTKTRKSTQPNPPWYDTQTSSRTPPGNDHSRPIPPSTKG